MVNLFLKSKCRTQNIDLVTGEKYIAVLRPICIDGAEWNIYLSNSIIYQIKITRGRKPILKILFFWTSTFFWRVLGTIWEQSIRTTLMGLLFLMLCESAPSFKAIGGSASFLMALSASDGESRVGKIKFSWTPWQNLQTGRWPLHSQIVCAWTDGWRVSTTHLRTEACIKTAHELHKGKQTGQILCTGLIHSYCIINICIFED